MTKRDKEKMVIDLYLNKEKTQKEISEILGYKSHWTVYEILKRNNISTKKPTKIKKEKIEQIINDHNTGKYSLEDLGKKYNLFRTTIRRLLKLNNVINRYIPPRLEKLNEEEILKMMEDYKTGNFNHDQLSEKYNVDRITVHRYFKKYKIGYIRPKPRKYHFNEQFFDNLDSQEKYWLLGWLYSDGNIHKNTISIGVHVQDKNVLNKILKVLGFCEDDVNKKVKQKLENFYQVKFDSVYMSKILFGLGCEPKKSKTIKFPHFINNKDYLWAFLRGLFEGDGSFGVSLKPKTQDHHYSGYCHLASGSKEFIYDLAYILEKELNIESFISFHRNLIMNKSWGEGYCLKMKGGTSQILKFLDKIYENSTSETVLDRKYNNYLDLKRRYIENGPNSCN
jgi:hypothetical protein